MFSFLLSKCLGVSLLVRSKALEHRKMSDSSMLNNRALLIFVTIFRPREVLTTLGLSTNSIFLKSGFLNLSTFGNSLAGQWLGLLAFSLGLNPSPKTKMPQATWSSQKKTHQKQNLSTVDIFRPGDSLLGWREGVPCTVGCWTAALVSTHSRPLACPQLWLLKLSPAIVRSPLWGNIALDKSHCIRVYLINLFQSWFWPRDI